MSTEKGREIPKLLKFGGPPMAAATILAGGVKNIEASQPESSAVNEPVAENHIREMVFDTPDGEQLIPLSAGDGRPMGDVDCNFKVNSQDTLKVLQYVGGLKEGVHECVLDTINLDLADVDSNKRVDSADALQILLHTAGVIDLENPNGENFSGHNVEVIGNEYCQDRINLALDILKEKIPDLYVKVVEDIGIVDCVDKGSGMYAWENPPRIALGEVTVDADMDWVVSVLGHEWKHYNLWKTARDASENGYVPPEAWTGPEAEAKCMAAQMEILKEIDAPKHIINHLQNIIDTEYAYWNIPFEERWWRKKKRNKKVETENTEK